MNIFQVKNDCPVVGETRFDQKKKPTKNGRFFLILVVITELMVELLKRWSNI